MTTQDQKPGSPDQETPAGKPTAKGGQPEKAAKELGGRKGPEPTRYGDWEKNGIISDF
jgi:hypothetical protein